tara:strand:+ start:1070 stop:2548 length:1479 start_codon:yes stop_codon:yes gene_type:complete
MQFSIFKNPLNSWKGDSLLLGINEDDINSQLEKIEFLINSNILLKKINNNKFEGRIGEILSFELLGHNLNSLTLIGLGNKNNFDHNSLRDSLSGYIRKIIDKEEKVSILMPWELFEKDDILAIAETLRLSAYRDNRFNKKRDEEVNLKEIEFIDFSIIKDLSFSEVEDICLGVEFARRLVAAPPNDLTPLEMSKEAIEIANQHDLDIKILEEDECNRIGMGAYLAVAKGSDLKPKFIHLTYRSKNQISSKIALVGKGLTFDSGGYNLKVGASQIEMMKYDMGGSAAVLGAAKAIGALKPKGVEIHFIVAACENMINGSAMHPGDVITAANGKTIEVNNTDAEGRLTLADALTYASNLKPDTIIDLATLTGACLIALGNDVAGMWCNDNELADELLQSASEKGEGLWRMPLQKSYKDGLKSHIADMKNTGPRAGGSITAALFLEEFVGNNIKWAHIDIAGTCWTDKNKGINPSGATGYGVRTLIHWIKDKESL